MVASQRPKGVTILAWLAIIGGLINLIAFMIPPYIFGVIGVLALIFGFGALALKPWAWNYGVALYILSVIEDIVLLSNESTLLLGAVGLVFDSLILYYLFTGSVKRVFGKA